MLRIVLAVTLVLACSAGAEESQNPDEKARKAARRNLDRLGRRAMFGGKSSARAIASIKKQLTADAEKFGAEFTNQFGKEWAAKAQAQRAEQLTRLAEAIKPDDKLKKSLRRELLKRRRHALKLIYSKSAYRKSRKKSQQKVNRLVALVREVWLKPSRALGSMKSRIRSMFDKFDGAGALLSGIGSQAGAAQEQAVTELTARLDKALDIRSFGYNDTDEEQIEQGAQIQQSNARKQTSGSKQDKLLLRLTNDYRLMMGLLPLALNDRLMTCARRHSEYMKKTGRFAHVDRGHTDGATPLMRARKAGYVDLVGENILMGASIENAAQALDGWQNSAGHHRNMLLPKYMSLGVGRAGVYWTQVFGHS